MALSLVLKVRRAAMENRSAESLLTKRTKVFAVGAVTAFPGVQIQYVGPKLFAGIDVAAAGNMTFYADDTDGETTVDPDIGFSTVPTTDGIIDLSAPAAAVATFGQLCDHINSMANWRCFLIGVSRDGDTDNKLDTLAEADSHTVRSSSGLTLFVDQEGGGAGTGSAETLRNLGFAITNNKFTSRPKGGFSTNRVGWTTDELCDNVLTFLHVNITNSGDGNIEIYACDDLNFVQAPKLVWDNIYVTATAEEHGGTNPLAPFVAAPTGQRLLIYFDVTSAAASACDVHAIGSTQHKTGGRVPDANYTGIA